MYHRTSVIAALVLLLLAPMALGQAGDQPPPAHDSLVGTIAADPANPPVGGSVTFDLQAINEGDETITYDHRCGEPFRWTLLAGTGSPLDLRTPDVACSGPDRVSLASGTSVGQRIQWDLRAYEDDELRNVPAGTYRLVAHLDHETSDGAEATLTMERSIMVGGEPYIHEDPVFDTPDQPGQGQLGSDDKGYPSFIETDAPCLGPYTSRPLAGTGGATTRPAGDAASSTGAAGDAPPPADGGVQGDGPADAGDEPGAAQDSAQGDEPAAATPADGSEEGSQGDTPETAADQAQDGPADSGAAPAAGHDGAQGASPATHAARLGPAPGGGTEVTLAAVDGRIGAETERLSFRYDSTAGLVRFEHRASPDAPPRPVELAVHGVFEFIDADGNGAFDAGEPLVQGYDIVDDRLVHFARSAEDACGITLRWTYFLTLDAATIDARVEAGDAASLADEPRLTLTFTHVTASNPALAVEPGRVKIDVRVDNFPFEHPEGLLGVRTSASAVDGLARASPGGERSDGIEGDPAALLTTGDDAPIGYAWAPIAVADGSPVAVRATTQATDATDVEVVFAYPAAATVLHDPELGVFHVQGSVAAAAQALVANPAAWAVGALVMAAGMGVLTLVRRR